MLYIQQYSRILYQLDKNLGMAISHYISIYITGPLIGIVKLTVQPLALTSINHCCVPANPPMAPGRLTPLVYHDLWLPVISD